MMMQRFMPAGWRLPPTLTARRGPIGLDLGGRYIKAAQLGYDGQTRLVAGIAIPRLHPGPDIDDEEVRRLRQVLQRRGFTGRQIVMSAPAQATMTSILTLPPRQSGAPLDQIARSEMAHAHRCEPETIEVAHWELPQPARAVDGVVAMAAACPHDAADPVLDRLERHGFDVIGLDLAGWALARVARRSPHAAEGIVALLELGWDSADVVLMYDGVVVYERQMSSAGLAPLSRMIGRDHAFDAEVVDYLLMKVGFELDSRGQDEDWRLFLKVRGMLETHFESVAKELNLALTYAQHQYPSSSVSQLLLLGGGAAVPGVADHLAGQLEVPVHGLTPAQVLDGCELATTEAENPAMMMAVGLADYERELAA